MAIGNLGKGSEELPAIWLDQITVYSDHHLFWVRQGVSRVWADNQLYELSLHEVLWLPAGTRVASIQTDPGSVVLSLLVPQHQLRGETPDITVHQIDEATSDALVGAYTRWLMPFWVENNTVRVFSELSRVSATTQAIGYPPIPECPPIADIATSLLRNPADSRSVKEWATQLGISERTITRGFVVSTGISFSLWRVTVRILQAIRLLREGLSPKETALAVGQIYRCF